jgi:hypothetical protein
MRGAPPEDEADPGAPELTDISFQMPFDFVRRAFLYLQRGWGWPEGGGWAEQDARLLDDLDTYQLYYGVAEKEVAAGWKPQRGYEELEESVTQWQLGMDHL